MKNELFFFFFYEISQEAASSLTANLSDKRQNLQSVNIFFY